MTSIRADGVTDKYKMYFIINSDLKMKAGKMSAQCAHAAVTWAIKIHADGQTDSVFTEWYNFGQPKVVLKATQTVLELLLQKYSASASAIAIAVHDAGRTQVAAGSLTVVCFRPMAVSDCPPDLIKLSLA